MSADGSLTATPGDIRAWVAHTVEHEMFADDPWPRTKAVHWLKGDMLIADVNGVHDANNALKDFAAAHGCTVTFTARRIGARARDGRRQTAQRRNGCRFRPVRDGDRMVRGASNRNGYRSPKRLRGLTRSLRAADTCDAGCETDGAR